MSSLEKSDQSLSTSISKSLSSPLVEDKLFEKFSLKEDSVHKNSYSESIEVNYSLHKNVLNKDDTVSDKYLEAYNYMISETSCLSSLAKEDDLKEEFDNLDIESEEEPIESQDEESDDFVEERSSLSSDNYSSFSDGQSKEISIRSIDDLSVFNDSLSSADSKLWTVPSHIKRTNSINSITAVNIDFEVTALTDEEKEIDYKLQAKNQVNESEMGDSDNPNDGLNVSGDEKVNRFNSTDTLAPQERTNLEADKMFRSSVPDKCSPNQEFALPHQSENSFCIYDENQPPEQYQNHQVKANFVSRSFDTPQQESGVKKPITSSTRRFPLAPLSINCQQAQAKAASPFPQMPPNSTFFAPGTLMFVPNFYATGPFNPNGTQGYANLGQSQSNNWANFSPVFYPYPSNMFDQSVPNFQQQHHSFVPNPCFTSSVNNTNGGVRGGGGDMDPQMYNSPNYSTDDNFGYNVNYQRSANADNRYYGYPNQTGVESPQVPFDQMSNRGGVPHTRNNSGVDRRPWKRGGFNQTKQQTRNVTTVNNGYHNIENNNFGHEFPNGSNDTRSTNDDDNHRPFANQWMTSHQSEAHFGAQGNDKQCAPSEEGNSSDVPKLDSHLVARPLGSQPQQQDWYDFEDLVGSGNGGNGNGGGQSQATNDRRSSFVGAFRGAGVQRGAPAKVFGPRGRGGRNRGGGAFHRANRNQQPHSSDSTQQVSVGI